MSNEISIADLSYDERLFLLAYDHILRGRYKFQDTNRDAENISRDHVQAQKIGYVLCCLRLLNDYCFSWNKKGPFSSKFQEVLIGLDAKASLVDRFYDDTTQNSLNELLPECLKTMLDQVGEVFHSYIDQYESSSITDNLELLGSLLYIGVTVFPGQGFDQVNKELQHRKSAFGNTDMNFEAWNCLNSAGLIPS